jgi:hypothetical protein
MIKLCAREYAVINANGLHPTECSEDIKDAQTPRKICIGCQHLPPDETGLTQLTGVQPAMVLVNTL